MDIGISYEPSRQRERERDDLVSRVPNYFVTTPLRTSFDERVKDRPKEIEVKVVDHVDPFRRKRLRLGFGRRGDCMLDFRDVRCEWCCMHSIPM